MSRVLFRRIAGLTTGHALLALLLVLAAVLVAADPATHSARAAHDQQKNLDSSISKLRSEIQQTSKQLAGASRRLSAVSRELAAARAVVNSARAKVVAARAEDARIAAELRVTAAREARTQAELAAVEARMEQTRQQVFELARAAYRRGRLSEVAVYLEVQTPEEVTSRLASTRSAMRAEGNLYEDLGVQRAAVDARRADLQLARERLAALRAAAQRNLGLRQAAAAQALAGEQRVQRLVAQARSAKASLERERANERRRLAQMEAEAAALSRRLRARVATGGAGLGSPSSAGLVAPVDGPITSPFGMRVHPITGVYKLHDGTDFGGGCDKPVYAITDGRVLERFYSGAWGNRIVVEHGSVRGRQLASAYNHLSAMVVSAGQRVRQGQLVGYVGTTGYSTGCHLHFNLYVNGGAVNPMAWL